ncbi:hypothetical protein PC129_g3087 [Phytophthora cactorum]|uniref:Uncharacterized protein n=1 Tax=Phytophthora cactorum TaxID=29920 RepID=A0A329SLG8_9STRA|nr:hypothetical protein Pcac1_g518 [Phytophthora cactorum]KAG2830952.1 hypothetical protein PC111_g7179 [Phytophthora cactorum]KAG2836724.1 hypothetical protein PC112_g5184 [Phytophthora cactorum]KAG2862619.1 hypothetical protein PC113_g6160 [Phytophthora cactorum]KAG2922981.1 hypothetical protein PC114_g5002 [Phytophthora cactorum]
MAHDGSNLFQIRRIFGFPTSTAPSNGSIPALKIASMAVHTLEKKQLLALAISEEFPKTTPHPKGDSSSTASMSPADAKTNFLLVRTIEEDQRTRFWRFPVCSTPKQQKAGKAERLSALEFSPEGDWLAALSQRKNRLHLVPILTLVANQRRAMLDASYQPTSHHRELMNVNQSAITTQMASYLRATNEYGGLNGARYHSQVAGDDEQMSTLEFAPGIGSITCVRWWRSLNGKNYCLVGGTESLISIVNVEENAEECRCELVNAGTIVSIDLLQENFRKERRTSMLVKAKTEDIDDKEREAGGTGARYYRVVLEKKFQAKSKVSPKKGKVKQEENESTEGATSTLKIATTTGGSSSSSETNFTTTNTSGGSSPFSFSKAPKFVVKTFPQHFLQDLDFRPQRIKKNSPQVCLYPINGVLSSESSLALYDCTKRKANLYSNFHWRLKGEYEVPDLLPASFADTEEQSEVESSESNDQQGETEGSSSGEEKDEVVDVDLTYCSTDLMLLQGRTSKSNETISTWVSLPSNQGMDEDIVRAHIVHYLSLHGNERIERVVQSTARSRTSSGASGNVGGSQSGEAEIIYILQTKHNVYECRPQWSRLALFKALCARTIALRDALSIGYALGIDMASLCQVVANTLYTSVIDGSTTADTELVQWVRELFEVSRVMPSSAVEQLTTMGGVQSAIDYAQHVLSKPVRDSVYDGAERRRVALLLVDLVFQQQLQKDTSPDTEAGHVVSQEKQDEEREAWLVEFLETNRDYMTTDIVDLCLSQQHVDKAILVATRRDEVPNVLEKIVNKGLASAVSEKLLRFLLESGHASALTTPSSRLILRSFPIEVQVEVLLAYSPAILQHRDWLERNLAAISPALCRRLAGNTKPENTDYAVHAMAEESSSAKAGVHSDVSTSEFMNVAPEEQVELYLTLLLHLNCRVYRSQDDEAESDDEYSQARLETLLKDLAAQYRPPIMVSRCIDYENWTAAACIYEAHGELVEALECRLHSHNSQSLSSAPVDATASSEESITRRRQQSNDSIGSAVSDESDFQEQMREELLQLLNSLVVHSHSSEVISEQIRAAILARILVKWFEYGMKRTVLEVFLIDPKVFKHVSSLLAQIFFSEVVDSILSSTSTTNGSSQGFDDRDKEWVQKCQQLPFSGQFLFRVCVSFLDKDHESPEPEPPTRKLLELVKNNVVENDLSHGVVPIAPHSAQALGKTDPLETHVKAFTCGHLFPKRVFEEEVVPEFEKRMNALPMPLFATKQAFTREFKRGASETPCPVCSFNKISQVVLQQYKAGHGKSPIQARHQQQKVKTKVPYYFLHREASEHVGFSAEVQSTKPLKHEAWEWSEQRAS